MPPDAGEDRPVRPRARLSPRALGSASRTCSTGCAATARGPRPGRRRYGSAARTRLRPAGRAGLDRQEHHADRPQAGELHLPGSPAASTSSWCPTRLMPPITAAPARAASTPARPTPSPGPTSSTPAAASATGRSSTRGRSPRSLPASSTAGSSAATSARTSVPGTAKRPRGRLAEAARSGRNETQPDLIEWLDRDADLEGRDQGLGSAASQASGAGPQRGPGAR